MLTRRVEGYPAMPLCRVFRGEPTRTGLRRLVGVLGKAQRWFSFAAVHRAALTQTISQRSRLPMPDSLPGLARRRRRWTRALPPTSVELSH